FERKRYWIEPAPGTTSGATALAAPAVGAAMAARAVSEMEAAGEGAASGVKAKAEAVGTVATLRQIFQNLSGIDLAAATEEETFYQFGFDSLFLTQASRAVSRQFGVEVTFRQ
ncbi:MAG: acyl carrier protein, partial [Verrucomicrobiota bacterium]